MDRQNEQENLDAAWRALAGITNKEGWRTIPVFDIYSCRVLAGRHFPGNEEAVLFGFSSVSAPSVGSLPAGTGFAVRKADPDTMDEDRVWLGLVRQPAGSPEFFAMMANDVVFTLGSSGSQDEERLLATFLGRIRAWQIFMEKERPGILGVEAELGLHGELHVLLSLLQQGVPSSVVVQGWLGPLDGIQDFQLPFGAVEVKATASTGTFPAMVSSLDQLDEGPVGNLFLAGVRFRAAATGASLPARVEAVRNILVSDPTAIAEFENRLLQAGYFPAQADQYHRTFVHEDTAVYKVDVRFPKITHGTVHRSIRKAKYEIDLSLVESPALTLESILQSLGAN